MITINLDEKNAELIIKLIKNQIDNIKNQIKQLETNKQELEEILKNMIPENIPAPVISPVVSTNSKEINPKKVIINNPMHEEVNAESSNYVFKEVDFDYKNLPEIIFGKNIFRRSEDGNNIYLMRSGYRVYIRAKIQDLVYLQDHPIEREKAISNLSKNKQTSLTRILKEVDFKKLDIIFQSSPSAERQERQEEDVKEQEEDRKEENVKEDIIESDKERPVTESANQNN